ncbi:hypothetical protein PIB30_097438 [Stylosanthes scabra]|uniref:Uncharacterized protein n=1 Tax=Stylosanthes scabra TaxID=79078 RepID=A0ABU6QVN5_9FABA|nr:hypothetical protein [Stylosanthes scabra]
MPCVKQPTKKSRGASTSMEPPPQDHPLAQWFYNKEDFDLYLSDFAPRKVVRQKLNFRRNYSKENACTMFNVPIGTPKPTVGLLNVEHRLLHYFLTYVLVPRSGNHSLILDEDLEIMWRMVNGQQINWVHLIVTHMRRTKPGNTKGLPYAILWTAIFKYVGINLSQADKKKLGYNHCIYTHVLNHMKRNVQEVPQQEEVAQPQEPQDQPSEQPSDQPSMRDLMQAIQSMELNMTQRMERIERNQARMLRKIRRVEAYTFSEDEAEDDDDDLDWS